MTEYEAAKQSTSLFVDVVVRAIKDGRTNFSKLEKTMLDTEQQCIEEEWYEAIAPIKEALKLIQDAKQD